jgi:hypothetical protein
MVGYAGHGKGVERLKEQGGKAADHHGGKVAVDRPGDAAGRKERLTCMIAAGWRIGGDPERPSDAATDLRPQRGDHPTSRGERSPKLGRRELRRADRGLGRTGGEPVAAGVLDVLRPSKWFSHGTESVGPPSPGIPEPDGPTWQNGPCVTTEMLFVPSARRRPRSES